MVSCTIALYEDGVGGGGGGGEGGGFVINRNTRKILSKSKLATNQIAENALIDDCFNPFHAQFLISILPEYVRKPVGHWREWVKQKSTVKAKPLLL